MNRNIAESKHFDPLNKTYGIEKNYNIDGSLKSFKDPFGNLVEYSYDNRGLMSSVDLNNTNVARYEYYKTGQVSDLIFANGLNTRYDYDANQRMTNLNTKLNNSSAPILSHEYTYDANSNRTRLVENGQIHDYTYDAYDQLKTVQSGNKTIQYSYSNMGNMTQYTLQENGTTIRDRAFDNNPHSNQLLSMSTTDNINGKTNKQITEYTYNPNGDIIKELTGQDHQNFDQQKNYL